MTSSAGSVVQTLTVHECSSNAVKSWLSGATHDGSTVSDRIIAEQLRAAMPETYED